MSNYDFIIEKINELRSEDYSLSLFGSSTHKYNLKKCIKSNVIRSFEKKYNIQLPEDYKYFLLSIGNGGAGPFYGILPFESGLYLDIDRPNKKFMTNPSLPFPLTEAWNFTFIGDYENEIDLELFDRKYFDSKFLNGTIRICNFGCGHFINLIINGIEYSNVWSDDRGSDNGIYPFNYYSIPGKGRLNFIEWYELWLDTYLDQVKHLAK